MDVDFQQGSDAKLFVRFSVRPTKNEAASVSAGRPVFADTEYVEIVVPGDKQNVVLRPVRDADKQRFGRQYAAFKAGDAEQVTGTPLSEWPAVTRSQVEELAYFKIRTVEQLAGVSDGNLKNAGPFLALRQKARDWLEKAEGGALESKLRAELDAEKLARETLQAQVAELVAELKKKPTKKE